MMINEIYLDSSSSPRRAFLLAACLSILRSRAALVRARLASISSLICLSRAFSALARWICTRLCQHSCPSVQQPGKRTRARTWYGRVVSLQIYIRG